MRIRDEFITYNEQTYYVKVGIQYTYVDDSFDHEFGTEECGHWELDEMNIIECLNGCNEDVDVSKVEGLEEYLKEYFED
jgi:hypothetical protein